MSFKSPLNYSGSKHDLIPQLLQHFPSKESVDRFYDVFTGGLSVTINTPYDKVISNDIIEPLIQFYHNLKLASNGNQIEEEIQKIKSYAISKESQDEFNQIREVFNMNKNPYLFFALVSSCTNNMMRFNKSFKFNQTFGKRTINDNTIQKLRDYCNVLKQKEIYFSCRNYKELFELFPPTQDDFIYLDPPYAYLSEAGYNAYWSKEDENYLYNLLDDLDKSGIRFALSGMSVNKGIKNPNLDKLDKYKIINLDYDYQKVARKKNLGESQEILVINY
jgi:adenine-specific DNA-methyltransferase